ncbi:MAG: hypothetical protein Q8L98_00345 [Chlamydiales bacterium]|nr:hypothetical protein [Chlamydiales bacterium]
MSAIGSQSLSAFESLPRDILFRIYRYLPDSDKDNFYDLSTYLRHIADEEIDRCLEKLKSHPTLKFILKHIEGSNLRDKVSRVYEFFKYAERVQNIRSANPVVSSFIREFQNQEIQVQPFDAKIAFKASNLKMTLLGFSDFANQYGNYNALFFNSFLKNEKKLLEQIDLSLVEPQTRAEGLIFSITENDITLFKKMITTLLKMEATIGSLTFFYKMLNNAFYVTISRDRKEMFCYLLSFKTSFSDPDKILFLLAEKNWGEEIEKFLALNPELNQIFVNDCNVHGVHSALMTAATKGHLSALNAMLKGIPDSISSEILQDVRHKLLRSPPLNKEEIIDILDQEIARRLNASQFLASQKPF